METNFDQIQLDEMRQQMAILRNKLDSQALLNEKLMRRAMADRFSYVDRQKIMAIVWNLVAIPFVYYVFSVVVQLSWQIIAFTMFFQVLAVVWVVWTYKIVRSRYLLSDNLKEVYERIQLQKKRDRQWKFIAYPFIVVFFAWVLIELFQKTGGLAMSVAGAVGCLVGLICGLIMMYRYNKTLKETESQIQLFSED